ncbi:vacuolar endopolyphosphatase-like protein [Rhexocercosporidium sp. MPI-PUGE-AT-0058]|nr:vacuolar endopolyphosphatase-like protein [Rhexocercosporidium sp. MPI-PUGE-AT-0058]
MHSTAILLAACLLKFSHGTPIGDTPSVLQTPLEGQDRPQEQVQASRQLHGRFLHITGLAHQTADLHPDPHYKIHSSTEEEDACHRGKGLAGTYGAETSDCDTPFSLINATFKWIDENIKDSIDFVIWTGDSARHDSDEKIPRNADEVLNTNRWIAKKFLEVFSTDNNPKKELAIPIISTFGNNDILPHNILLSGPNKWLKTYTDIWSKFIPEEQRHGFERGGWYFVEVIPKKLAVFSLNTLYFFDHNAAVDGCALRSEPGYEHFEWLRIQLQFIRDRGMKAILIGHVPPARTASKQLWDETCWQKYTLWLDQYRDVVIGGLYGHMNIDHFMLQDKKHIDLVLAGGDASESGSVRTLMDEELSIESANDYLEELRADWSSLPNPNAAFNDDRVDDLSKKHKGKKSKKDKALKKIGGPWGERFQVTHVGPSIVPNFFPTLRVIEYNISGLDLSATWANAQASGETEKIDWLEEVFSPITDEADEENADNDEESIAKKKKKHKKPKKPKNPDLIVPFPPSKSSPPGPGYSPQSLTLLGYTQYFANLTYINHDTYVRDQEVDTDKWHEGKHKGKHPKDKVPHPNPFRFEVEYDTFTDPIYKLKDLTVRSYIKLAHRIGQYKPSKGDRIDESFDDEEFDEDDENIEDEDDSDDDIEAEKKEHKKKKHHHQHEKNKVWLQFVRRAFVGTLEEEDLQSFEADSGFDLGEDIPSFTHDDEL